MNRTLRFGEGLFETIRWLGENRKLGLHYRRLSRSAELLGIPCPSYEEFLEAVKTATGGERGRYVRLSLLSKGGDRYADLSEGYEIEVLVKDLPAPPKEVSLTVSPYRRHSQNPLFYHKTTSYLFSVLVKRHAEERGFYDAVVLNERGEVTECSASNLILLCGERLVTPRRGSGLLWGTTLEALCGSVEIQEESVDLSLLMGADAVFITNSLIGVVPVRRVEDRVLGTDPDVLRELRAALESWEAVKI